MSQLTDSHIPISECTQAVEALHKAHDTSTFKLLAEKQHVWLVISVKTPAPADKKVLPTAIPIKYPLVDPRTNKICLITKDPQADYRTLLEENNVKFVTKVVGISKLKSKFKPFEARKLLLDETGLFLADERIVPLLPSILGKKWHEAKKQPIPVSLTSKNLKRSLEKAICSTYMHQNAGGNSTSIKISTLLHTPAQTIANLTSALPVIIESLHGKGWDNVRSIHIKTNSSAALPLWDST